MGSHCSSHTVALEGRWGAGKLVVAWELGSHCSSHTVALVAVELGDVWELGSHCSSHIVALVILIELIPVISDSDDYYGYVDFPWKKWKFGVNFSVQRDPFFLNLFIADRCKTQMLLLIWIKKIFASFLVIVG